jgi:hypothetical protein
MLLIALFPIFNFAARTFHIASVCHILMVISPAPWPTTLQNGYSRRVEVSISFLSRPLYFSEYIHAVIHNLAVITGISSKEMVPIACPIFSSTAW